MVLNKISPLYITGALLVVLSSGACTDRTILPSVEKHVNAVIKSASEEDAPVAKEMKVWFVKPISEELTLVAVDRGGGQGDELTNAVEELLRGPSDAESSTGLSSEIPKGTILLGVKHDGEDIELNLSKRFASGGGTSIETRIEQLRRTISDIAGQHKVYLDVEGERLSTTTGEGLEVKQPINM